MLDFLIKILLAFLVFAQILGFVACSDDVCDNQQKTENYRLKKESLEKANRYMVLEEKKEIEDYVERNHLNVEWIGTGLCYSIVKQGDTIPIEMGDIVSMDYEVRLLNDDLIYSSQESGIKTFVVGRGGVEVGLEETIVYLHKNDEAVVIIPSNSAHGLLGDGDRIPPKTTLVYKIKIIDNQSYKYNNKI